METIVPKIHLKIWYTYVPLGSARNEQSLYSAVKSKYIEYFCNTYVETNSPYKNMLHFSISLSLSSFT